MSRFLIIYFKTILDFIFNPSQKKGCKKQLCVLSESPVVVTAQCLCSKRAWQAELGGRGCPRMVTRHSQVGCPSGELLRLAATSPQTAVPAGPRPETVTGKRPAARSGQSPSGTAGAGRPRAHGSAPAGRPLARPQLPRVLGALAELARTSSCPRGSSSGRAADPASGARLGERN